MARIVETKTTEKATAGLSVVVKLPAHQTGDLLLIWVALKGASPGSFSVTGGWTINSQGLGQGNRGRAAYIYKIAASSSETAPTVTAASGSSTWAAVTMAIRGVNSTTPIDTTTQSTNTATHRSTSPTITTTTSNALVIYGAMCDSNQWWTPWDNEPVAGVQHLALSSSEFEQINVSNVSLGIAWSLKPTAGTSLAAKWYGRTVNWSNRFSTIAIRDDGTGQLPGYQDTAVLASKIIDPISGSNRPFGGDWVSATGIATTIGGKTVVAYGYPGGTDYQNYGVHPYFVAKRVQFGQNTSLNMVPIDLVTNSGASCDATWGSGLFLFSIIPTTPPQAYFDDLVENAGLIFMIWDTTGTPRWRAWTVGGADANPGLPYGRVRYLVQASRSSSQLDASGTAPTLSAIEGYMIGANNVSANYFDIMVNQLHLLNKVTLVGGSSTRPAAFQDLLNAMNDTAFKYYDQSSSNSIQSYIPLEIGGSVATYTKINGASIAFVGSVDTTRGAVNSHIDTNKLGINFNPASGDSIALTNTTISSPNQWYLTISSGAANVLDWTGSTFIGAGTITLRAVSLSGFTLNQCLAPTLNSATLSNVTISESKATSALNITSTTEAANLSNMNFVNNTAGHSITLSATGTYTFDNFQFSGGGSAGSSTADVYNNSGGAVTINITNGGDTPTIRNGTGSSTTVQNSVPVTLTVTDESGSPISGARVLMEAASGGPATVGADILTGTTDGAGVITTNYAFASDQPVKGWVRKSSNPYYKQGLISGTITSSGYANTIIMIED